GGLERLLPVHVAQTGRQLPEAFADRVPVLTQERDPPLLVEGDHGHRVVVPADLPVRGPAARHGDGVHAESHHVAVEDLTTGDGPELVRAGGGVACHGQLPSTGSSDVSSGSGAPAALEAPARTSSDWSARHGSTGRLISFS